MFSAALVFFFCLFFFSSASSDGQQISEKGKEVSNETRESARRVRRDGVSATHRRVVGASPVSEWRIAGTASSICKVGGRNGPVSPVSSTYSTQHTL